MNITNIVPEVLLEIVGYLDRWDLTRLSETSRFFYNFLSDEYIGKRLKGKIRALDTYSKQLLKYTLEQNHFMVETLLQLGADPNRINFLDNKQLRQFRNRCHNLFRDIYGFYCGMSPFSMACFLEDEHLIRLMLKYDVYSYQEIMYYPIRMTLDGKDMHSKAKNFTNKLMAELIMEMRLASIKILLGNGFDMNNLQVNNFMSNGKNTEPIVLSFEKAIFGCVPLDPDALAFCSELSTIIMERNVKFNVNDWIEHWLTEERSTLLDILIEYCSNEAPVPPNINFSKEDVTVFFKYLRQRGAKTYKELEQSRRMYYQHPQYQYQNMYTRCY